MPSFYIAMLIAAIACICGRESVRVARLAGAVGNIGPLLGAVALGVIISTTFGAWAGTSLAPTLPPAGRVILLAIALGVTGLEVAVLRAPKPPAEPTRSAGAIVLVVLAAHLTGAAGFLAMGMAAAFGEPVLVAIGAFVGGFLPLVVAAMVGKGWEGAMPLGLMRWLGAGALFGGGIAMAWSVAG